MPAATVAAGPDEPVVMDFDIPSQRADLSLTQFAEQADITLIFAYDLAKDKTANRLVGRYETREAIELLLGDTGLKPTFGEDEFINIEAVATPAAKGDQVTTSKKTGFVAAVAAFFATVGAAAQDGANEDNTEDVIDFGEEIIVTGSRLPSAPASSPIVVIDRKEIDARGLTNVEDIIRYLPQNYSTVVPGALFSAARTSEQGAVTANLRGLGEGSTLVLVNGKRISASPVSSGENYTDVSTIPFSAIERVEVMPDGGSAIYGSDAVGGVINFIMKKDYRGSETRLRYDSSSSGGDSVSIEQNLGATWAGGNLTVSLSHNKQDAVRAEDAGIPLVYDHRDRGGRWFPNLLASQPGLIRGTYPPSAPPGGLFAGVLPPGDGTNVDENEIDYVTFAEFFSQSGNYLLLPTDRATLDTVIPETTDTTAYLSFTQQLGADWSFDVTGIYARADTSSSSQVNNLVAAMVPESNYYNNFGGPVQLSYNFRREVADGLIAPQSFDLNSRRWNLFANLDWDLPVGDWSATASVSVGEDRQDQVTTNDMRQPDDPLVVAALESGDPDTALNLLGDGTVQHPNLDDLIFNDDRGSSLGKQRVLGLDFTGSLFDLPGGTVQMALGAEKRVDELDFTGGSNSLFFELSDGTPILPESESTAWYVELGIPLVGADQGIAGIQKLGLQLAYRSEEYDITGLFEGVGEPESGRSYSAYVPKIGLAWNLVASFKIRASWGEAFQAPRLNSLFNPQISSIFLVFDPLNPDSNGGPNVPVFPQLWFGGNPDLDAQTSETRTFGFDYAPNDSGLRLSATWAETDFEGIIASIGFSGVDQAFVLENSDQFPNLVIRDANGVLTDFYGLVDANLARRIVESIDLEASYDFETAAGDFIVGVNTTNTRKFETILAQGLEPQKNAGTDLSPPEWKGNAYIDWSRGNWGGAFTVLYQDGYRLVNDPDVLRPNVGSYTTFDVQATYAMPDSGWELKLGVQNLTDADFPFVDNRTGVDNTRVDFRRRVVYVNVNKAFSW